MSKEIILTYLQTLLKIYMSTDKENNFISEEKAYIFIQKKKKKCTFLDAITEPAFRRSTNSQRDYQLSTVANYSNRFKYVNSKYMP